MRQTTVRSLPSAFTLSMLLHVVLALFFTVALLPCSAYESLFEWLHLPANWNPIACPKPLSLPGPIIETSLVGPTGSPPPRVSHAKSQPHASPAPPRPQVAPPQHTQPQPSPQHPKPLPAPPKHPDVKDQEKVVQDAPEKAEDAKRVQEEKQKQRQAELDAQAAKKKKSQEELDKLFAQMDAAQAKTKQAAKDSKAAEQQLKQDEKATDDAVANVARAAQKQTGSHGRDQGLLARYLAAVQNAVTQNWLRPDNMPDQPCLVHIVQLPGGQVLSAHADASCPYDEAGRQSVENAVLRAQPLPYQGFESVFQRNLTFTFRPQ